eukprot:1276832-Alexandrium_andersonii.AAC.1
MISRHAMHVLCQKRKDASNVLGGYTAMAQRGRPGTPMRCLRRPRHLYSSPTAKRYLGSKHGT